MISDTSRVIKSSIFQKIVIEKLLKLEISEWILFFQDNKSAKVHKWFDSDDLVTFPLAPPSGQKCILALLLPSFPVEQHFWIITD